MQKCLCVCVLSLTVFIANQKQCLHWKTKMAVAVGQSNARSVSRSQWERRKRRAANQELALIALRYVSANEKARRRHPRWRGGNSGRIMHSINTDSTVTYSLRTGHRVYLFPCMRGVGRSCWRSTETRGSVVVAVGSVVAGCCWSGLGAGMKHSTGALLIVTLTHSAVEQVTVALHWGTRSVALAIEASLARKAVAEPLAGWLWQAVAEGQASWNDHRCYHFCARVLVVDRETHLFFLWLYW